MNLKENKILTLALIEEYNPDSDFLSDDEDIIARINSIYNACLMNLATTIRKIQRTYTYDELEKTETDYYEEVSIPQDCYMIRDIIVKDRETNAIKGIQADYQRQDDKTLLINCKTDGVHILRYYAYPKHIPLDLKDDEKYKFDIDQELQYVLPYAVASDILKSDRSVDYTAFENKYRTELSRLTPQKEEMQVFINDNGLEF